MASMMLEREQRSLRYYAQRHCARQWVHFLAAMFAEFDERVDRAEAEQFLEILGMRMARMMPLPPSDNLGQLEADINAILEDIDWGWARVAESDHFLEITHGAYPMVPQDETQRCWLAPVLEGLYSEWLGEQGGDRALTVRLADRDQPLGSPLVFYYGRHGQ